MRLPLCLAAAILLLGACSDDARRDRAAVACPWPTRAAPEAMSALADDLAAHLAARGSLPADLARLDASGLAGGGPHAGHAYAYHPAGMGILHDGWRVVAVDDRRRDEQAVWCVLRPPVRVNGSPTLVAALVGRGELRQAAAAAGGVAAKGCPLR